MPFHDLGSHRLHYEVEGPEGAPWVLLLNSLGADISLWDRQRTALARVYRVLRYDQRGHGGSSSLAGDYELADLGREAIALLDALSVERAHVCGISLGGVLAMWVAVHAPKRVDKLVLANTNARIGTKESWDERIARVRAEGSMQALVASTLERWFTAEFRAREPALMQHMGAVLSRVQLAGYVGCCAALREADLRGEIARIVAPTLVIGSTEDPLTTPSHGQALARAIPGAEYVELAAAHLSNVEAAGFTDQVLSFLAQPEHTA